MVEKAPSVMDGMAETGGSVMVIEADAEYPLSTAFTVYAPAKRLLNFPVVFVIAPGVNVNVITPPDPPVVVEVIDPLFCPLQVTLVGVSVSDKALPAYTLSTEAAINRNGELIKKNLTSRNATLSKNLF
jgi:hypothetical protein